MAGFISQSVNLQRSMNITEKPSIDAEAMRKKLTITDVANSKLLMVKKGNLN
jgi:hypothetical protein